MGDETQGTQGTQGTTAKKRAAREWMFPEHYLQVGGKRISVRYPTASEERDILAAAASTMTAGMVESATGRAGQNDTDTDVKIRVAQDCIISFDGKDIRDDQREDVWNHEFDGWARSDLLQWVSYCMTPADEKGKPQEKPSFLL